MPRRRWRAGLSGLACGCVLLLAAGCGGAHTGVVATAYLRAAQAGNHRLDHDFDALNKRDTRRLAAADADLRDIAATERLFDRRLAAIPFPPPIREIALRLIFVNEERARLTERAASSASLPQLGGYLPALKQANRPVEAEVSMIRGRLGLPPPGTS